MRGARERAGRCLHLSDLQHGEGIADIAQDCQPAETGDDLAKQLGRPHLGAYLLGEGARWAVFRAASTNRRRRLRGRQSCGQCRAARRQARQAGKPLTIGFLGPTTPSSQSQHVAAFSQRLRDAGVGRLSAASLRCRGCRICATNFPPIRTRCPLPSHSLHSMPAVSPVPRQSSHGMGTFSFIGGFATWRPLVA